MKHWLRDFRLVPIVLIAAGCLLALKAIGLMFDGGYTLGQRAGRTEALIVTTVPLSAPTQIRSETLPLNVAAAPAPASRSWMQEMFNYPDVTGSVASRANSKDAAITGSAATAAPAGNENAANKPEPAVGTPESKPAAAPLGVQVPIDGARPVSSAERAILERLHARRQELDARARELELRETLLKAAEKKLEDRMGEMKAMEARLNSGLQKKEQADAARFKSLVTMYETMKPKDAAKIFDRLEMKVLIEVASQINPRRMSEIMSVMSAEAAEKLTVELTARASPSDRAASGADLPKIEGKPSGG